MHEMTLRPAIGKWISVLLGSAAFTAAGIFIAINDEAVRWTWAIWVILLSGAGVIVALLQFVPGASELRLSAEGFMARSMFRGRFYRWDEVGPFHPIQAGGKRVGFDLTGASGSTPGAAVARALSGASGALPDTYGRSVEDLATLMNDWRNRALDPQAPQDGKDTNHLRPEAGH